MRMSTARYVMTQHLSLLHIHLTDNAQQTNWQKKPNVLKKQGTLSETN